MNIDKFIQKPVRSSAILTASYVPGTVISDVHLSNQLNIYIDFTKGSLTTAEVKIEFSADNTNWYQETSSSITGGTETNVVLEHALGATGAYRLSVPIKDRYVRISAKGTGTATGSAMAIKAVVGWV